MSANALPKVVDEVSDLLAKIVIPLYVERKHRAPPEAVATGFLIRHGQQHFLVTAAHAIETIRTQKFYYYVSRTHWQQLSGQVISKGDPADVAVVKLTGDAMPPYPALGKCAVDSSWLRPHHLPRGGKQYLILGFPASQSKPDGIGRHINSTIWGYRHDSIPDAEYAAHGINAQFHIALPFNKKKSWDSDWKQRNFPPPTGLSGAPIFELWDSDIANASPKFSIVGVGTAHRKQPGLLIGTDAAIVLAMIADAIKEKI